MGALPRAPRGVTWSTVTAIACALPEMDEGLYHGLPALRVRKKFFARQHEDGETLVLKVGHEERDMLLAADPAVFYVTPHYHGYPMVLVRLSSIRRDLLAEIIEQSWRSLASARALAAHDAR